MRLYEFWAKAGNCFWCFTPSPSQQSVVSLSAQPQRTTPAQRSQLGLCFSTSVELVFSCGFIPKQSPCNVEVNGNQVSGIPPPITPLKAGVFPPCGFRTCKSRLNVALLLCFHWPQGDGAQPLFPVKCPTVGGRMSVLIKRDGFQNTAALERMKILLGPRSAGR